MQPTPEDVRRTGMLPRHRLALALLSLPLAVVLVACGTSSGDAGTSSAATAPSARDAAGGSDFSAGGDALTDGAGDADGAPAAKPAADTAIQRSVIATGSLRLSSAHLADARQDAINLANGLGGHVADEQSQSDSHGRLDRVDLSLRVTSASFEKALDGPAELGTVRHREQSVEDVTTQVIDVAARVKAQRASVESIEQLLARATTIGDVMSIERQLASRQAELDSLEQQQKYLADQTSLSTIQVTLTRPTAHDDSDDAGLLSGLEDGWRALGATAVALVTVIGAVLPFAAVLALVGVPLWLVVRRRRVVQPAPVAPEA
jgi:hypothetical protein